MVKLGKMLIKKNLIIISVVAVVFLSCGSLGSLKEKIGLGGSTEPEETATVSSVPADYKPPTLQEQAASGYWISRPQNNTIIIIGVSNRMVRESDEITAAKEDAARKAAMFHGIQGSIEHTQGTSSGGYFGHVSDYKVDLQYDSDVSKYIDRLVFDPQNDVFRIDGGVMIRFQYAAEINYHTDYVAARDANGRPEWANGRNLPQIEGFSITVGQAQNQRWLKDTVYKAVENAAAALIQDMNTQVQVRETSVTGQSASSYIYAVSEGRLTNFHVLEMWIDPETGYAYTLAIARPGR